MSLDLSFFSFLFLFLLRFSLATTNSDNAPTQPSPAPPATTIPAFPEQSSAAGCRLDLPGDSFRGVKAACHAGQQLHRSRCCPVLAAWLYAAHSAAALTTGQGGGRVSQAAAGRTDAAAQYDLPVLPDDSEACAENLGKAMEERGMELAGPNKSCDLVFCYCGIRLRPLTCPGAFSADRRGELVGDGSVKRLEKACLSSNADQLSGLGGCNNCLNKLYMIGKNSSRTSKSEDKKRTTRMHDRDCEIMAVTWLLAKNRTAYIRSVSLVLRALIMSTDGSDPLSCTLDSDGMPLAVDSAELFDQSRGRVIDRAPSVWVLILSVSLLLSLMVFA